MTDKEKAIQKAIEDLKKVMGVPKPNEDNIWFDGEEHKENFIALLESYQNNAEYASACYVCAHPEIHNKIDWHSECLDTPLDWYWGEWIEEEGRFTESEAVYGLSSGWRALVRAAVEMFSSRKHYFDLSDLVCIGDDTIYRMFVQLMQIRKSRQVIKLK
ncbi:DUF2538 family protein [Brevibacillus brevis]|uniref:DUF2538 family protein n=1 Tax=Brevibacillus brevis TaxID=1393 RepID=A0ABY9TD75_BREBE|nr:DUF2538 family protein [Brevibacillus brevis]WNC17943.1 DUF2538 family protein [Brevibacillus brevis]